ncbi:hypothetical protein HW115_13900 [Verrucomicrobiaceae bacterium N1E253]|uniref:Channel forming colicins domain-containing protein n=1 Tax=Oceaniferula marina TaxID=2748318 RepID=A0A851GIF4_9BACT|nr:hypothetical protein [Oceaniferula marina]NWK56712.1 hypothetical protein [Oceaniferula marina]
MPVNGLLLTLTEDEKLAQDALLVVAGREDIELGERTGRWQPVVVETEGTRQSHEVHEWLQSVEGVLMVDVVFSSVSEPGEKVKSSDQEANQKAGERSRETDAELPSE